MKYFFLFLVALFLSGVMAWSYIPQKMMGNQDTVTLHSPVDSKSDSYIDLSIPEVIPISDNSLHAQTSVPVSTERVANSPRGNGATQYQVTGDRSGKVTVKNTTSGWNIGNFQMDEGVVVRETFLLDGGKTVAASQKDKTIFWDLKTRKEIRRFPERIHGFSHDETQFFTWKRAWGNSDIFLYSYPDMKQVCKILSSPAGPPDTFHFSPNDRFLAVSFYSGVPLSDEDYISPPMVMSGLSLTNIFNIQKCEVIEEFSKFLYGGLGKFSPDSRFYVVSNVLVLNRRRVFGDCNFNLSNYKLENCTNTTPQPQPKKQRFVQ